MRKATVIGVGVLAVLLFGLQLRPGGFDTRPPERPRGATCAAPAVGERSAEIAAGEPEGPATGQVRVEVFHGFEDDRVADARIEAACADGVIRTAVTGADGSAVAFDLPAGRVRLVARAAGYADSEEEVVEIGEGRSRACHFRLEPAGPLNGRVVDAETGRPVSGVRVTAMTGGFIFGDSWRNPQELDRVFGSATTAGNGRFTVEGVPREPFFGLRLARVEAPGYRTLLKVAPPDGKDGHFVIRLVPGGTIEGRVTTPGGEPVGGARVVAVLAGRGDRDPLRCEKRLDLPERFLARFPSEERKASASDGSFRISGLPAGSVEVEMRDPRFLPFETTVTLPLLAPVEFTVRLGAVLFVRATDEDGHPATRRHVRICPEGEEERSAASGRTNAEGEFRARLLPGKYRIRVGTRDWAGEPATTDRVELAAGDARTVRLEAPAVE